MLNPSSIQCEAFACRKWGALHFRHAFATNLIRNTKNMGEVKEAAEILEDNYEVLLRTYFHTDSEKKVNLVDALVL